MLARIVHRNPYAAAGASKISALDLLFGVGPAYAATAPAGLPGAIGAAPDSQALFDQRYLWDLKGNLLHAQGKESKANYAYDAQDRLIGAGMLERGATPRASYSRYFHDGAGNRLLAQEDIAEQSDMATNTVKTAYAPASNRWAGAANGPAARYDAAGQPDAIGQREYVWDAYGRLKEVRQEQRNLASYRYNYKGERVSKRVGGLQSNYLYEGRRLIAELDGNGTITRQYIYLADQPVALIDSAGEALESGERSAAGQVWADLRTTVRHWSSGSERIAYLHNNHLGATEVISNDAGRVIWRAAYSPYGKAVKVNAQSGAGFSFNLRLPGQYADAETGLHYNDHRYYDPQRGQYLTPDPIGLRGGINSYAYVANNPLKYVDPTGLILFAFDGTNNSNPPPDKDHVSNVVKFAYTYDDGRIWYMNGVGRDDPESHIETNKTDEINGNTARARVDYILKQLDDYMSSTKFQEDEMVNIDIVGFSRGAAMGRDFSNKVAQRLRAGTYKNYNTCVALRFMGLWDTVAQFGLNGADNDKWELGIPPEVKNTFQAVALNEYRYLFPGESIIGGGGGGKLTEAGFIGSHADIGDGYAEGDLSDIPLMWIYKQAKDSGIKMKSLKEEYLIVSNPILHNKELTNDTILGFDRKFRIRDKEGKIISAISQKNAMIGGLNHHDAEKFIRYYPDIVETNPYDQTTSTKPGSKPDSYGDNIIVGDVNMKEYAEWLKKNYDIDVQY